MVAVVVGWWTDVYTFFCYPSIRRQERKQKRQKLAEEAKTTAGGNGNGGNGGAPQAVETASAAAPATKADKEKEKEEEEPEVVPVVPFEACLASSFANPQLIEDYASPALPATAPRTSAVKTQRFKNFPPYLVVHLQRYYVDTATWQGKKMEVSVPMPLELDLSQLRCVSVWGVSACCSSLVGAGFGRLTD